MDASAGGFHAALLLFFTPRGLRSPLPLILAPNVSAGSEEPFTGAFLLGEELGLSNSLRAPHTMPIYFLLNENSALISHLPLPHRHV